MRTPLLLLAGGLLAILGTELVMHNQPAPVEDAALSPSIPQPLPAARPPFDSGADTQGRVDRILARPLFDPSRRPGTPASPQEAGAQALPRLSAVLVSGRGKSVIFAGRDGGKALTLGEGGRIGAYQVQSIAAGQVTLSGPDGTHVIRPALDRAAAAPAAAAGTTPPSMLDLLRAGGTLPPGLPGLPPAPAAR